MIGVTNLLKEKSEAHNNPHKGKRNENHDQHEKHGEKHQARGAFTAKQNCQQSYKKKGTNSD
jgi:hypothetical protein